MKYTVFLPLSVAFIKGLRGFLHWSCVGLFLRAFKPPPCGAGDGFSVIFHFGGLRSFIGGRYFSR